MKTYQIPEQLLVSTLNYLSTKPFAEVYQLIGELQKITFPQPPVPPMPPEAANSQPEKKE